MMRDDRSWSPGKKGIFSVDTDLDVKPHWLSSGYA